VHEQYGQTLSPELASLVDSPNARANATRIPLGTDGAREALVFQPLVPSYSNMSNGTPRGMATLLAGFLEQKVGDVVMVENTAKKGRPQQMLDRAFDLRKFDPNAKASWQPMMTDGGLPDLVQVSVDRIVDGPHVAEMRLHRVALGSDVPTLTQQIKTIHEASPDGTIAIGCNSGQDESGEVAVLLHQRETAAALQAQGRPVTAQALEREGLEMLKNGQALRGSAFARALKPGGSREAVLMAHAQAVAAEFAGARASETSAAALPVRALAQKFGGVGLRPSQLELGGTKPVGGGTPGTRPSGPRPMLAAKPKLQPIATAALPAAGAPPGSRPGSPVGEPGSKELVYADLDLQHHAEASKFATRRPAQLAYSADSADSADSGVVYTTVRKVGGDLNYTTVDWGNSGEASRGAVASRAKGAAQVDESTVEYATISGSRPPLPTRSPPVRERVGVETPPLPRRSPVSPSTPMSPGVSSLSDSTFSSGRSSPLSASEAADAAPALPPRLQQMHRASVRVSTRWAARALEAAPGLPERSTSPSPQSARLQDLRSKWTDRNTEQGQQMSEFVVNAARGFVAEANAGPMKLWKSKDSYGAGAGAKRVNEAADKASALGQQLLGAGGDLDPEVTGNDQLATQLLKSILEDHFSHLGEAQQQKWLKRSESRGEVSRSIVKLQAKMADALQGAQSHSESYDEMAAKMHSAWLAMTTLVAMKEVAEIHRPSKA
jgi:hypothetical protein